MSDPDRPTIVNPNGITFQVIPMDECVGLAETLQAQTHRWHSHALWPGCLESPYSGYAVVIEDAQSGEAFISPSDIFPEVDKVLVRMLHGEDILDPRRSKAEASAPARSKVLEVVRAAVATGEAWHHHMCFPDCAFNREPGMWTISIESGEDLVWDSWDDEPTDVLWELEILCFSSDEQD